jgi:hypothetical protein
MGKWNINRDQFGFMRILVLVIYTLLFPGLFSCDNAAITQTPGAGVKEWGSAEKIGSYHRFEQANTVEMAADNNGNLFVAGAFFAKRYVKGSGWYIYEPVCSADGFFFPQVVENKAGHIGVVWYSWIRGSLPNELSSSVYNGGGIWNNGGLSPLNTLPYADVSVRQYDPSIHNISMDMNDSGDMIAVWEEYQTSPTNAYNIGSVYYSTVSGWTKQALPGSTIGYSESPHVVFIAGNQSKAVWTVVTGSNIAVYENTHTPGSGWGNAVPVTTVTASNPMWRSEMGKDPAGNIVLILCFEHEIWSLPCSAAGVWGPAVQIRTSSDTIDNHFRFKMNAAGQGLLVWRESRSQVVDADDILARPYLAGSGWGAVEKIDLTIFPVTAPEIDLDGNGNCMVAWRQQNGLWQYTLRTAYRAATGAWSAPVDAAEYADYQMMNYKVKADSDGNFHAVWGYWDVPSQEYQYWANKFE